MYLKKTVEKVTWITMLEVLIARQDSAKKFFITQRRKTSHGAQIPTVTCPHSQLIYLYMGTGVS